MKYLSFLWVLVALVSTQTLYELLEVSQDATSDELKKAFRRLSVMHHPDRNDLSEQSLKKYVAIKRAYEILIDVSQRITYNLHGEQGLARLEKQPLQKGGDYRTQMSVPLAKFYVGGEEVFSFRRGEICKACKGSGDHSGKPTECQDCKGTGKMTREVNVKGQLKQIEMKCKTCGGTKFAPKSRCPVCNGKKILLQPRDLHFQIEKGMQDGDVVHFKGESEQGFQFYPGDVYVKLNEIPHPQLKRDGNNLRTKMFITLQEAVLGFSKTIKHLDGREVVIEGYEVQDQQDTVVEGQGMPIRGQIDAYGDLLMRIQIKFKPSYSEREKQMLRRIFALAQENDL